MPAALRWLQEEGRADGSPRGGRAPGPGVNAGELPRERLARLGAEALRDQELLALLLGTGYRGRSVRELAGAILEAHTREGLMEMGLAELGRIKGIGRAKASTLIAAFELARRGLQQGLGNRPIVSRPGDVVPLLAEYRGRPKEFFVCLYLNARNQVVHQEVISIGSLSASIVHPREVFQVAVSRSAASVILAHNHPSGDVSPSRDDLELTRRLIQAGEILGIEVLDHVIISAVDFVSLKERGLMS
ncbi:MAG: DNA repair protein RadC [Candidatus Latescibacterota bacterium]